MGFLEEILPRSREPAVCSPTPPPLPRPGLDLTTSLTSCTRREPSSTGTWERAWRRESSPRPERTWLLLRETMRRLGVMLLTLMTKKNIEIRKYIFLFLNLNVILYKYYILSNGK